MSLINRMLQDLDQRGSGTVAVGVSHAHIKTVPEVGVQPAWWPALLLMAVLGAVIGGLFWGRAAPATAKPAASVPPPIHVRHRTGTMSMSLSIDPDHLTLQEKSVAASAASAPNSEVPDSEVPDSSAKKLPETELARVKSPVGTTPLKPLVAALPKQIAAAPSPGPANVNTKEVTPQQHTENIYRKAIALIDAGQLPEAIGALEQVLQQNPKHAAARQALAGLLLEGKRQDDAMRTLQEGLAIDPAQSGMAMILARLQVERGKLRPALETLQRTLPHAAEQADYQAFLAALLQREERHKEAAEHYALALRKSPQNGLWWMGYGISLQANNRLAEAQEAFTRARESTALSVELQAFVDQKLSQMRR